MQSYVCILLLSSLRTTSNRLNERECENINESEQKKLKYALRGRLDIEQQQR